MLPARRLPADLALAAISLIWGATFVVIKRALEDSSPLTFILLRFLLAAGLLLSLWGRRVRWGERATRRAAGVVGSLLFAGYAFQTAGLEFTSPAKSAFLTALSVVLVPLILVALSRQKVHRRLWLGVAAAALGTYALAIPAGGFRIGLGDALTLVGALAFAGHIVAVGHYARRQGFEALAVGQVVAALALSLAAVPLAAATGLEPIRLTGSLRLGVAVLVTGGLATALAFSVQTWAQQFTSPTHTAILYSLEPVFAALTSFLVLGERLGGRGLLGAGLILAGVLLAELESAPEVPGMPGAAGTGPDG